MSQQRRTAAGPLAEYPVGTRVQTKEGYSGVIEDIHEGPRDLTTYYVTLDAGQGGGAYAEAEIWPVTTQTSSVEAARTFAQPVDANAQPNQGVQTCANCGGEIFYNASMSTGSKWIHSENWIATCPKSTTEGSVDHTAQDDYPELGTALVDHLPPEIKHTVAHLASLRPVQAVLSPDCVCGAPGEPYGDGRFKCSNGHLYDPPPPDDADGSTVCAHCGSDDIDFDSERCRQCGSQNFRQASLHPVTGAVPLKCADCGLTYYTDQMDDPHHTDCQQINGAVLGTTAANSSACEECQTPYNFSRINGTATFHVPSNAVRGGGHQPAHDETVEGSDDGDLWHFECPVCGYDNSEYNDAEAFRDLLGVKQGFYLPLDNADKGEKFDNPDEEQGWRDGSKDGKAGITRNMQDPTNIAYRAGYDRGWAYGVEIFRAPAGGFDLGDFQTIEQMQTVDPPSNRLGSASPETEDLPFFALSGLKVREAGELWELIKGSDPENDPLLKGYLSYDWCRYRRDRHCYYSKALDVEASQQAGYAVWTPEDRGPCYRNAWDAQEKCPIALPGPHVDGGFTDATVAWEAGGQHGGAPTNVIRQDASISVEAKALPVGYALQYVKGGRTSNYAVVATFEGKAVGAIQWKPEREVWGGQWNADHTEIESMLVKRPPQIVDLKVDKAHQRKGLATAMYAEAKQHEPDLVHDDIVLPDGEAWMKTLTSALDPTVAFMLTATWKQVRDKAKKIRADGHVRIIASQDGIVTGHVRGDTNVYETEVVRGSSKAGVSHWTCGCKWAAYSWGRSGPWKKYEGRMCSHALALQYEAQARGMFGRTLTLDESQPEWMDSTVPVRTPNSYDRSKGRYSHLREATAQDDDAPLLALGGKTRPFPAKVWGRIVRLFIEDGRVRNAATDTEVAARDVLFPGYDPVAGLDYVDPRGVRTGAADPKRRCQHYGERTEQTMGRATKRPYRCEDQGVVEDPEIPGDWYCAKHAKQHGLKTSHLKTASPLDDAVHAKTLSEAADDLLLSARNEERTLTPLIANLARSTGGEMTGLEHRFKTKSSLMRKMTAEANLYPSPGECALNMSDSLRYTMVLAPSTYARGTTQVLNALKNRGYQERVKNYWERGDAYNGVNAALTAPSGHPVELQFHTDSSLEAKGVTHPLYDVWRASEDPSRRSGIAAKMVSIADASPVPPGVNMIQPFKRLPQVAHLHLGGTAVAEPRFLLIHDVDDAPLAVLRVDTDGDVARWQDGSWVERLEYGRFTYLGEPRTHEITETEADDLIGSGALNTYGWPVQHAAKEETMSAEEWGILADLHEIPEAALPTTDGGDDEDDYWESQKEQEDAEADEYAESERRRRLRYLNFDLYGVPYTPGTHEDPSHPSYQGSLVSTDWLMGIDDSGADQAALAVAAALAAVKVASASPADLQALAEATISAGSQPDREIMAAAQAGLDKRSLKDYSHSERQQIIAEGENEEGAGNLDRLDLSGTHYEALEARRSSTASTAEAADLGWDLLGDPNGER